MDIGPAIIVVIIAGLAGCFATYLLFKWSLITKLVFPMAYVGMLVGSVCLYMGRHPEFTLAFSSFIAALAVIFILVPSYFYFKRYLIQPFHELGTNLALASNGDLTRRASISSDDEFGQMARQLNQVIESLSTLITQVRTISEENARLAQTLSGVARSTNTSSSQVSNSVQEIAKSAQELSKHSVAARTNSEDAEQSAANGMQQAGVMRNRIESITTTTGSTGDKIQALGDQSRKIGAIIETINKISEQTNLLALNAAIEAARAGDSGRGFAVVADEVRKLAEESKHSTEQISELVQHIQLGIEDAVSSMSASSQDVKQGAEELRITIGSFQEIPGRVQGVKRAISEVSAIAEENAAKSEEMSAAVQEVAAAMQHVTETSQQLADGALRLNKLLEQFKT